MKKSRNIADKICNYIKVIYYVILLFFPAIADMLFSKATVFKDLVFGNLLITSLVIAVCTLIVIHIPQITHLFSLIYLVFSSFLLESMVTDAKASIDSGMNSVDVAIKTIPFLFLFSLALLFVYNVTSNSISFYYGALRKRDKRNYNATMKSIKKFRVAERNSQKQDIQRLKGKKTNGVNYDLNALENDIQKKNAKQASDWANPKLSIMDRILPAILPTLLGAIFSTVVAYAVFTYSKDYSFLAWFGEALVCNLMFLITDIVTFFRTRGGTTEDLEKAFAK